MKKAIALGVILLTASAVHAEELTGTLKKIKSSGAVTLGYRESSIPFSYYDDKKQPVGYSLDLCMKVVDKLKTALNEPNLQVKYQAVDTSNRIAMVKNGTVDIECGSSTNTVKRQQDVSFSNSVFIASLKFVSKVSSSIKSADDLKGKTVVVTNDSVAVPVLDKINEQRKLGLKIVHGKTHADSYSQVQSGTAAAFIEGDVLLAGLRATSDHSAEYTLLQEPFSNEPYGFMLRKDDAPFKKVVDEALNAVMKSGEIERIYYKWFMSPLPGKGISMNLPMSPQLRDTFKTPNDKPVAE